MLADRYKRRACLKSTRGEYKVYARRKNLPQLSPCGFWKLLDIATSHHGCKQSSTRIFWCKTLQAPLHLTFHLVGFWHIYNPAPVRFAFVTKTNNALGRFAHRREVFSPFPIRVLRSFFFLSSVLDEVYHSCDPLDAQAIASVFCCNYITLGLWRWGICPYRRL